MSRRAHVGPAHELAVPHALDLSDPGARVGIRQALEIAVGAER